MRFPKERSWGRKSSTPGRRKWFRFAGHDSGCARHRNERGRHRRHPSIASGERTSPGRLRPAAGGILCRIEVEHLLRCLDTHDPGHDHVRDRFYLLFIQQVHRTFLVFTVGRFDIRIEVHLKLETGSTDELAVVELDEQTLEIHRVREIEVVEQELEYFVFVTFKLRSVVEKPGKDVSRGLFDLPDHHEHLLKTRRGSSKIRTATDDQGTREPHDHDNIFLHLLDLVFNVEDLPLSAMSFDRGIKRHDQPAFEVHLVDHVAGLFQHLLIGHRHLLTEDTANLEQAERCGSRFSDGLFGPTVVAQQFDGLKGG